MVSTSERPANPRTRRHTSSSYTTQTINFEKTYGQLHSSQTSFSRSIWRNKTPAPPPIYDDIEATQVLAAPPQHVSLSVPTSWSSSCDSRIHTMTSIPPQKASDRMLALAASPTTSPERIAAMQAVPISRPRRRKLERRMARQKEADAPSRSGARKAVTTYIVYYAHRTCPCGPFSKSIQHVKQPRLPIQ